MIENKTNQYEELCPFCGKIIICVYEGRPDLQCSACGGNFKNTFARNVPVALKTGIALLINREFERAYSVFNDYAGRNAPDYRVYWYMFLCARQVVFVGATASLYDSCAQSVTEDKHYNLALKYCADADIKAVYIKLAEVDIEPLRSRIEAQKEENLKGYDIFISFKQSALAADILGDDYVCINPEYGPGFRGVKCTVDAAVAVKLYDELEKKYNNRVFGSFKEIETNENFAAKICHALKTAKVLYLVLSKKDYASDGLNSPWVHNEIKTFMHRHKKDFADRIIPIIINGAGNDVLPEQLSYVNITTKLSKEETSALIRDYLEGENKAVPLFEKNIQNKYYGLAAEHLTTFINIPGKKESGRSGYVPFGEEYNNDINDIPDNPLNIKGGTNYLYFEGLADKLFKAEKFSLARDYYLEAYKRTPETKKTASQHIYYKYILARQLTQEK